MSIHGDLRTMTVTDLVQWAGAGRKTGTLEVERNNVCKRVVFREGKIVGSSSDDPRTLLGQVLLSHGSITEEHLRLALRQQQDDGRSVGTILVEWGVIGRTELLRHVAAKAEETIYSLFDWEDGFFRFHEAVAEDPYLAAVELRVDDVLLRGLQRCDEMRRIRDVLPDGSVVLRRTAVPPPDVVTSSRLARTLYEAVDGERSVDGLLLRVRSSEFLVRKFLASLVRGGHLEIVSPRKSGPRPERRGAPPAGPAKRARPAARQAEATSVVETIEAMLGAGKVEEAFGAVREARRNDANDPRLSELDRRTEAAYRARLLAGVLPLHAVPTRAIPRPGADDSLDEVESFLMTLVDGRNDIRSVLWLAPMREMEALAALERLRARGRIELTESG